MYTLLYKANYCIKTSMYLNVLQKPNITRNPQAKFLKRRLLQGLLKEHERLIRFNGIIEVRI